MTPRFTNKDALLNGLPPEWSADCLYAIRQQASRRSVVVLDDDPTGTQTVHGIPVLTEWSVEALRTEIVNDLPCFYILTNSRSLPLTQAQALNEEIAHNLRRAAEICQRDFEVVSRSDSTLRGHFPGEVEALAGALGKPLDGWLIIPFFLEGGRYTVGDIHYVAEGDQLIPAGDTPFARDRVFGYQNSNLREWLEEKTGGRVRASEVASISIEDVRVGGPARVAEKLMLLTGGQMCVVNAASYRDMEVFVLGLLQAEAKGKRFLHRTAASFVRVRSGIEPRALLKKSDLQLPAYGGGLVIVGSYVPKTNTQVAELLRRAEITGIEVSVDALLDSRREGEIARAAEGASIAMGHNRDVVLYTSRRLVTANVNDRIEANLSIGRSVSDGLIAILGRITAVPRYLVAKGGITSSDIATQGLNVKRAIVRGQILPGVPVWRLGEESKYPGLDYIVFPGNVGTGDSLAEIVQTLGKVDS